MKKMKKNIISKILTLVFSIILYTSLVNAVADFNATPTSFNLNAQTSEAGSGTVTIENTGDENLNITITKADLSSGDNTITLTLSETSITQLAPAETEDITFTYTTGTQAGTYAGSLSITDGNKTENIPIALLVESQVTGPSLIFENEGSILEIVAELGEEERKSFTLLNNGNETLTNIRFELEDLDGDDDRIRTRDVEFNGDEVGDYEISRLTPGESDRIRISVDVDDGIDVDDYRGDLEIRADRPNGETYRKTFTLKVMTESDDEDVYIKENSGDVIRNELIIIAEPGEIIDDYEIVIRNDGSGNINDLYLQLDGDLEEEKSSNIIRQEDIEFSPNPFDIDDRDEERIEVIIEIPEDTPTGDYIADLELRSASGKKLDEIIIRVKVVGDIYFSDIEIPEKVNPGDSLDIKVTVRNQGSKIYRNVKITATLFDIQFGSGDITRSTSTFLLTSGSEKEQTLRFSIPEDARDGEAILEIKVDYDSETLYELESVNIQRLLNNIVIDSYSINPRTVQCDKQVFTYIKFRNLGQFDRDVQVKTEIVGTNIETSSSTFELGVDDIDQQNLILDVSTLEPGTYTVAQKIIYAGGLFVKKESQLSVLECNENGGSGVIIKPINETQDNVTEPETDDTINLFGNPVEKTTVYLGSGLAFVVVLIVIGLFLI